MTEMSGGRGGSIRLACLPPTARHDYLKAFYAGLAQHGVYVEIDGAPYDDRFFAQACDRIDALHLHWPEYMWRPARGLARARAIASLGRYLAAARRAGMPVIWTAHNVESHERGRLDAVGYQLVAWQSDLILCHDEHSQATVRRWLRRRGSDVMKIRLGNFRAVWPAPRSREQCRADFGIPRNRRLLVSFGLFRPYKGFDVAMGAMRFLPDEYVLVVAGPPEMPEYADRLATEAAAVGNVRVIPSRLDVQALVDLLHAADAVVLPYRAITGSAAMLGALTAHCPVVTSDLPFFRETLALEPSAGTIADVVEPRAFAAAIEKLFSIPAAEREAAVRRLSALHEWSAIAAPIAEWLHARTRGTRERAGRGAPSSSHAPIP
jgi:glycosyltransferase involved in cell wall biosynthesis